MTESSHPHPDRVGPAVAGRLACRRGRAAALVLAACGGSSAPGGGGSGGGADEGPLTIGISLPLTGDFSQPGGEAKRGYQVWADMVNADGGVLGRQVKLKIVDDASNQDTVVSDYTKLITQDKVDLVLGTFSSLLNFPASAVAEKNGYVFVEPAGGAPDMFTRGFKYLFFAQPATAPHQADVFVDYIKSLPEDQRPATAAYPTQDDPFTRPVIESMQTAARGARREDGLLLGLPGRHDQLPDHRQHLEEQEARPDRPGRGVRGRRRPGPVAQAARLHPQGAVPDVGAEQRRPVQRRCRRGQHRGRLLHGQLERAGHDAAEPGVRRGLRQGVRRCAAGRGRGRRVRRRPGAAEGGRGGPRASTRTRSGTGCTSNEVETILGPLSWNDKGEPQGDFILAQWQSGKVQVVGPADAATSDTIVYPKPPWSC